MVGSVSNGAFAPTPSELILPVRGRTCTEVLARTLKERYAASVARQRTATKGPGKDSSGGATFRPGRCATPPSRLKHCGRQRTTARNPCYGRGLRTVRVSGGLAWTQWLTMLTGESPTPSLLTPGQRRPISMAKRSVHAAVPQPPQRLRLQGRQLPRSNPCGRKGHPCARTGRAARP